MESIDQTVRLEFYSFIDWTGYCPIGFLQEAHVQKKTKRAQGNASGHGRPLSVKGRKKSVEDFLLCAFHLILAFKGIAPDPG